MAFEMAHNLTLEWARKKKGRKLDYCIGMGEGLEQIAYDEKEAEEKRAKEAEEAETDADNPVTPTPAAMHVHYNEDDDALLVEDDDASDDEDFRLEPTFKEEDDKPIDVTGDFEDELQCMVPKEDAAASRKASTKTTIHGTPTSVWFTSQALVHFRQSAKKVAEEYFKGKDIKVGAGRKRKYTVKSQELYEEGVRDSKDVDVKRRRIEASK